MNTSLVTGQKKMIMPIMKLSRENYGDARIQTYSFFWQRAFKDIFSMGAEPDAIKSDREKVMLAPAPRYEKKLVG